MSADLFGDEPMSLFRYDAWVKAANGPSVAGSQVYVLGQPANLLGNPSPLLQVYADVNGLLPLVQPLISDGFGHVDFYVSGGPFTVGVYFNGILQNSYADQYPMGLGSSGTSVLLETNYVANAVQNILNLVAGSNVTLVSDSSGDVTINAIVPAPPTPLLLQTNSVVNTVQSKLNLVSGTGITLASDGSGDVTITSSVSSLLLETNGTPNTVQSKLNLAAGTNVTLTSDSSGDVTIASSGGGGGITFSTPGQGYFWSIDGSNGFAEFEYTTQTSNGVAIVASANQVLVMQIKITETYVVSAVSFSTPTPTGTCAFGLYNASGALVLTTGVVNLSALGGFNNCIPVTLTTISPGIYYFAQTASTNSSRFFACSIQYGLAGTTPSNPFVFSQAGFGTVGRASVSVLYNYLGIAGNSASGSVLPSSLGGISAFAGALVQTAVVIQITTGVYGLQISTAPIGGAGVYIGNIQVGDSAHYVQGSNSSILGSGTVVSVGGNIVVLGSNPTWSATTLGMSSSGGLVTDTTNPAPAPSTTQPVAIVLFSV